MPYKRQGGKYTRFAQIERHLQSVQGQGKVREIPVWSKVMEKSGDFEMGLGISQIHIEARELIHANASPKSLNRKTG